jgi:hypothetical protein
MATVYVIWNRVGKTFVGGPQPLTFPSSADANSHLTGSGDPSTSGFKGLNDQHKGVRPEPQFDVVGPLTVV